MADKPTGDIRERALKISQTLAQAVIDKEDMTPVERALVIAVQDLCEAIFDRGVDREDGVGGGTF